MTPKEARQRLLDTDTALNKGKKVEPEHKRILLTLPYRELGWGGPKPTPLPKAAIEALGLEDKTGDARWSEHFLNNPRALGLYRTRVGYYWLLYFDGLTGDHVLENAGAAGDCEARFGKKA